MQDLFTILFLIGFFAFFIFVVLAIKSVKKQNGKAKRHWVLTGIFLTICCVGLFGIRALADNSINAVSDQTEDTTAATVVDNQNALMQNSLSLFNMTTDEFKNVFNSIVGKYRLNGLGITKLDLTKSQENDTRTFQYTFSDDLSMVGVLNSNEEIQEIMLIGNGGFSEQTGGTLMTAIATLIMTTNSEYTYNDAQDVIKDIGLLDSNVNLNAFDGATVRNGFKYRFKIQDNNISTFGITAAK
ncbi:hypothetical protein NZ043_27480 [Paenibacillus sp. FSL k6-2145]|uniref:hypothetical protein n=1 Tax=Paenibacillus sp. FSL k6-2145 TaxID=2976834 RepID=UPI0030D7BA73